MKIRLIAMVILCAVPLAGEAQLFKCKGPDGKVVYSDSKCEASATTGALPPGVSNKAHENEAKAAADKAAADKAAADAKVQAEALVEAARKAGLVAPMPAAGATPPATPPQGFAGAPKPHELTGAERDRLRSLEVDASRQGASAEQKAAARLEMDSIRTGREARLSSGDRARRESLYSDLVSTDAKKRSQAMSELRSIYNR